MMTLSLDLLIETSIMMLQSTTSVTTSISTNLQ